MKRANDKVGVGLLLVLLCWWRLLLHFVVDGDEDYAQGTIYTCFAEHSLGSTAIHSSGC